MILYKTVGKAAQAEQIIEKSRFITHVRPVASREEADSFFAEIKKEYKDATHNVPAMVIGDKFQIQWASDDGEPQGTSGAPIVQMLVNEEITNVALVVTRYFGGVKLGTGGLVRAYQGAVKEGLAASVIVEKQKGAKYKITTDYNGIGKLQYIIASLNIFTINTEYTENVDIEVMVNSSMEKEFVDKVVEGTNGKVKISRIEEMSYVIVDNQVIVRG